jgi:tetratricopeptide (TPR) repeat protein
LNFEQVEQLSTAAADLLRVSVFLNPDTIPLELITQGAMELSPALATALANVKDDPLTLDKVLAPRTRFSLIRRNLEARTYNIHRLEQEVLKAKMDDVTQRLWAERTVRAMSRAFPNSEFSTWPRCERLLPHSQACAELIKKWAFEFPEAAQLLNQAGSYLRDRAHYAEAEPLYQRALVIWKKALGPEDPAVADSLNNNLGWLYYLHGKHAEAEPLYQRALAIREKAQGLEPPAVAWSLNNLAELYYLQGKYAEAEPLYLRALAIRKRTLEPEHPDVANSLNNLGLLYSKQGKYAEADRTVTSSLCATRASEGSVCRTLRIGKVYRAKHAQESSQKTSVRE